MYGFGGSPIYLEQFALIYLAFNSVFVHIVQILIHLFAVRVNWHMVMSNCQLPSFMKGR